jgi:hypothetical protein
LYVTSLRNYFLKPHGGASSLIWSKRHPPAREGMGRRGYRSALVQATYVFCEAPLALSPGARRGSNAFLLRCHLHAIMFFEAPKLLMESVSRMDKRYNS